MLAILFSEASLAQEEKSAPTMWSGGTVNYTTPGGNSGWLLGPTFGMMLHENMAVGGTLTLQDGGSWEIAPYFRYYMPVTDNFRSYAVG